MGFKDEIINVSKELLKETKEEIIKVSKELLKDAPKPLLIMILILIHYTVLNCFLLFVIPSILQLVTLEIYDPFYLKYFSILKIFIAYNGIVCGSFLSFVAFVQIFFRKKRIWWD